jgi:phosphate-selective porin
MRGALWVKDETHNVAGSHKARHLMGLLLYLAVVEGGPGLWQVGARYEVLDLKDGSGDCFGTGVTVAARRICGGVYNTVGAVVNWQPVEFIKVTGQYATTTVRGGNNTSATNRRDGSVDVVQARVQFDF